MQKDNLYFICSLDKLIEKRPLKVEIKDFDDIAVFKVNGKIAIISNICPHKRLSSLSDGLLAEETIFCPHHNYAFNIYTGERSSGGAPLKTYNPIIIDKNLYIELDEKKPKWAMNI